jgi:hypothetical protein
MFEKNNNGQTGNSNGQTGNSNGQAVLPKKTTRDEGKTFDKVTDFVCVNDCFVGGKRYRRGDVFRGGKCPPWFNVKPEAKEKDGK